MKKADSVTRGASNLRNGGPRSQQDLRIALVWYLAVPEGHPKIAQRFIAGVWARGTDAVP